MADASIRGSGLARGKREPTGTFPREDFPSESAVRHCRFHPPKPTLFYGVHSRNTIFGCMAPHPRAATGDIDVTPATLAWSATLFCVVFSARMADGFLAALLRHARECAEARAAFGIGRVLVHLRRRSADAPCPPASRPGSGRRDVAGHRR